MSVFRNYKTDSNFILTGNGAPSTTLNPNNDAVLYINKDNGDLYTCLSNTINRNIWVNQRNGYVVFDPVTDIFNDNSCVAFYKFENNVNDETGVYNGVWNGNENYGDLKYEKGIVLDGSSYVEITNNINLIFSTNKSWSISCFVRWDAINNWSRAFDFYGYLFINNKLTTNELYISHKGNGVDGIQFNLVDFIDLGVLYYIVITYNHLTDTHTIYINTNDITSNFTVTNVSSTPTAPLNTFGRSSYSADSLFKGSIDHVRIFNRAITQQEVNILNKEWLYI